MLGSAPTLSAARQLAPVSVKRKTGSEIGAMHDLSQVLCAKASRVWGGHYSSSACECLIDCDETNCSPIRVDQAYADAKKEQREVYHAMKKVVCKTMR